MAAATSSGLPGLVDTYQLYIDGRWVEPEDGRYDDISPATEQTIATAPDASVGRSATRSRAARRAFDEGPWATVSPARARRLPQPAR